MSIKMEARWGHTFQEEAQTAKIKASYAQEPVEFEFNGISCLVDLDTDLEWLFRDYQNAFTMDWKTIGPACVEQYDEATLAELNRRREENEQRYEKAREEQALHDEYQRHRVQLLTAGTMLLIHDDKQQEYATFVENNSKDGYSRAVIDYAEAWAKLMQREIAAGRTVIADIADECQKDLGYLGITGFQYGCAVQALSRFWAFGEELRQWHNKAWGGAAEAEGVVNPAVLTLKTD